MKFNDQVKKVPGWQEPKIFKLADVSDKQAFDDLLATGDVKFVSDEILEAIEELYHIEYPAQIDEIDDAQYKQFVADKGDLDGYGSWVYYPWNATIVHLPPEDDLARLRGSRNRNLITDAERIKLADNKTILILGLSVGSNVVDSLLMQAIGSRYILVDMDHLGPTNLNRIRASYDQIGVHKVDVVAKKISELNPYLEQVHYKDGVNDQNLEEMLLKYKPDIIVDEMDSLRMKILIRTRAKELGIPVLMATDDGDDILLDIERYDQNSEQGILHGILPDDLVSRILSGTPMSRQETGAVIGQYFVSLENVPIRMIESVMEVGKTLPSWPQLGGAAVLAGLFVAYAAKKILLGQELNDGRFVMGPEEQLNPEIKSPDYVAKKSYLIEVMTQSRTSQ